MKKLKAIFIICYTFIVFMILSGCQENSEEKFFKSLEQMPHDVKIVDVKVFNKVDRGKMFYYLTDTGILWGVGDENVGVKCTEDVWKMKGGFDFLKRPVKIAENVQRIIPPTEMLCGYISSDKEVFLWGRKLRTTSPNKSSAANIKDAVITDDGVVFGVDSNNKMLCIYKPDNVLDDFELLLGETDVNNIYCMGNDILLINKSGELIHFDMAGSYRNKLLSNVVKLVYSSNGFNHILALSEDGTVYELGNGYSEMFSDELDITKEPIKIAENVKDIACGDTFTIIVDNDSELILNGYFPNGAIGESPDFYNDYELKSKHGTGEINSVFAWQGNIFVNYDNSCIVWGENYKQQISDEMAFYPIIKRKEGWLYDQYKIKYTTDGYVFAETS